MPSSRTRARWTSALGSVLFCGCGGHPADSASGASIARDASSQGASTQSGSTGPIDGGGVLEGTDGGGDTGPALGVAPCTALPAAGQWENITPPGGPVPMSFALDDTGAVWLGMYGQSSTFPSSGGIYKSADCGSTWSHLNTGMNGAALDTADIWSMAVDLESSAMPTVYAIGIEGPDGLLKSTNGGVDWTQLLAPGAMVADVVPAGPSNPAVAAVASISMGPTGDHQHLVIGVHVTCAAPYGPICDIESTNGGATWTIVNVPVPVDAWEEQTGPYVLNATSWLHASLANGLWLTTDHGSTWTNVTPSGVTGATGGEYTVHPFVPATNGAYYLPSYGPAGLLTSTNGGQSWSRIANAPQGQYAIAFAEGGGNLYLGDGYAGTLEVAAESDPTTWSAITLPPQQGTGWGVWYLQYDGTNHLLYALIQEPWSWSGLWRIVTQ